MIQADYLISKAKENVFYKVKKKKLKFKLNTKVIKLLRQVDLNHV